MRQRAAILLEDARAGRFPAVCVATGEPATGTRRKVLVSTPAWTWPLLVMGIVISNLMIGLVIFAIARFVSTTTTTVELPISDGAGRLWSVGGYVDGPWLWITGVHPTFAHALGRSFEDLPEGRLS